MIHLIKRLINNVVVEGLSDIGRAFIDGWKEGWNGETPAVAPTVPEEQSRSELLGTRFGDFYVGQAVTYSVYPLLENGLGMATRAGIITVGQTYGDYILGEDGLTEEYRDICEWEIASDVRPRI
jgi:hypothetical protein